MFQINNIFENAYFILVFAINCLEFLILGLSQVNWRIEYVNVNSTLLLIFPVLWFSTDYVFHLWQSPVTPGNLEINHRVSFIWLLICQKRPLDFPEYFDNEYSSHLTQVKEHGFLQHIFSSIIFDSLNIYIYIYWLHCS